MNTEHAKHIRQALREASRHDEAARQHRREAGWLLAELRAEQPREWHRLVGIDYRSGELLIELACGGRTADNPPRDLIG